MIENQNIPVFMVNLKRNIERREITSKRLQGVGITAQVSYGLDCLDPKFCFSEYKEYSSNFWGDENEFKPGAFGCYLSHARYWEFLLDTNAPYAVIVEDDVIPNEEAFERLNLTELPNDFDFISLNEAPFRWVEKLRKTDCHVSNSSFLPFSSILSNLIEHNIFIDKIPANGAYGYLVSRRGAKKMLENLYVQKVCMGVDYAMLFNSLTDTEIIRLQKRVNLLLLDKLKFYVENIYKKRFAHKLNSYIYTNDYLFSIDWDFPTSLNHNLFISNEVFKGV